MHVEGSASILALIELNHLTKTFKGKTQTVDALKDINLHIEQGDIFGIIGMSGAGKSTLVRCINFLEQPTSGSVVIDGKDLASLSPKALRQLRQQVSMIFQHFNLLSQRDVRGNIAFAMEIAGMKRPQIEKRIDELLEIVGLTDRQHNYPSQLSGGQQQRVAIALWRPTRRSSSATKRPARSTRRRRPRFSTFCGKSTAGWASPSSSSPTR